jgi:hypothetical protein
MRGPALERCRWARYEGDGGSWQSLRIGINGGGLVREVLVRRISTLTVELERLEATFATAGGAEPEQLDSYQRVSNTLRRLLESVGLERRARDVTPSVSGRSFDPQAFDFVLDGLRTGGAGKPRWNPAEKAAEKNRGYTRFACMRPCIRCPLEPLGTCLLDRADLLTDQCKNTRINIARRASCAHAVPKSLICTAIGSCDIR